MDKNEDYKSRKFVLVVLVVVLATLVLKVKLIDADAYVKLICFALGAYVLGNVGQKGLEWWLGATGSKTP